MFVEKRAMMSCALHFYELSWVELWSPAANQVSRWPSAQSLESTWFGYVWIEWATNSWTLNGLWMNVSDLSAPKAHFAQIWLDWPWLPAMRIQNWSWKGLLQFEGNQLGTSLTSFSSKTWDTTYSTSIYIGSAPDFIMNPTTSDQFYPSKPTMRSRECKPTSQALQAMVLVSWQGRRLLTATSWGSSHVMGPMFIPCSSRVPFKD